MPSHEAKSPLKLPSMAATLALAAAFAAAEAHAQADAIPKPLSQEFSAPPRIAEVCEPGGLAMAGAPMFRVQSKLRSLKEYLHTAKGPCPRSYCPPERSRSLDTGDIVFAGPEDRGFRRVAAGAASGNLIAGFLPVENLAPVEAERALLAMFLAGIWIAPDSSGRATRLADERVRVEGKGIHRARTMPNDGAFSAEVATESAPVPVVRGGSCIVVLERRGPYLLADDNAKCGGHNVRLVGIYLHRPQR